MFHSLYVLSFKLSEELGNALKGFMDEKLYYDNPQLTDQVSGTLEITKPLTLIKCIFKKYPIFTISRIIEQFYHLNNGKIKTLGLVVS